MTLTEENNNGDTEVSTNEELASEPGTQGKSKKAIRYKANGQLFEDEIPDQNSEEYEPFMKDVLAGWRGKRKEKGFDDPGEIRAAMKEGIIEGLREGKPKEEDQPDDPYTLMSPQLRKRYDRLVAEGTEDDRFQFLVDLGMENRKAHFEVFKESRALKDHVVKRETIEGAIREMHTIRKMDPDFPDPDTNPEEAFDELNKSGGFFEWTRETGITGNINRAYKLYLADTGKEVQNRKPKTTEEVKKQPQKSQESAIAKIANTMGNVSGGGSVVGRDADEAEIRHFIQQNGKEGIKLACDKYGKDRTLEVFNKARGINFPKR